VAVIYCDQAGAFTVATPLLRGLRERYPNLTLDYLGGEGVKGLEEASPLIDSRYSLFGRVDGPERVPQYLSERTAAAGPYALAVNLESEPAAAEACRLTNADYVVRTTPDPSGVANPAREGIDRLTYDVWNRHDLLSDYAELNSQFLAEIFCRLARVQTDFARLDLPTAEPDRPIPPVLFCTGVRRSVKSWPAQHWADLARWTRNAGFEIGVLGGPPGVREKYHAEDIDQELIQLGAADLRGVFTLPQVAGAITKARVLVTPDTALMHFGAAVGTPTVVMFGDGSPRRIWAPPAPNMHYLTPAAPCPMCEDNRFKNDDCLLPVHQCMLSITPMRVIAALEKLLVPS
jgi:heptosyltransferase III